MWFKRKVQTGHQLGRTIGFPTINLNVGTFAKHYSPGIYAAEVKVADQIYKGALHFGPTPKHKTNKLEVHLINFSKNIYGQWVQLKVNQKIREPMQFTDLNELKKQIKKDLSQV